MKFSSGRRSLRTFVGVKYIDSPPPDPTIKYEYHWLISGFLEKCWSYIAPMEYFAYRSRNIVEWISSRDA